MSKKKNKHIDFGFKKISIEEKNNLVKNVFDNVANNMDVDQSYAPVVPPPTPEPMQFSPHQQLEYDQAQALQYRQPQTLQYRKSTPLHPQASHYRISKPPPPLALKHRKSKSKALILGVKLVVLGLTISFRSEETYFRDKIGMRNNYSICEECNREEPNGWHWHNHYWCGRCWEKWHPE